MQKPVITPGILSVSHLDDAPHLFLGKEWWGVFCTTNGIPHRIAMLSTKPQAQRHKAFCLISQTWTCQYCQSLMSAHGDADAPAAVQETPLPQPDEPPQVTRMLVVADRLEEGGDIADSYSLDRIAYRQPIKTFVHEEVRYCTGKCHDGYPKTVDAYEVLPIERFTRESLSYTEKTHPDRVPHAREDPRGFYDSIQVIYRGQPHVLVGPPMIFQAAPADDVRITPAVLPKKQLKRRTPKEG